MIFLTELNSHILNSLCVFRILGTYACISSVQQDRR